MPLQLEHPTLTKQLHQYRQEWVVRGYNPNFVRYPDELRDVTSNPDVNGLQPPPSNVCTWGTPPLQRNEKGPGKYIWVIRDDGVPYADEDGESGKCIKDRNRLSHTNLTGGRDAHCGGELWFVGDSEIYINGGSGRYPPRSPQELESIVGSLTSIGFTVVSAGWSEEVNQPARFFRGGGV